MTTNSHDNNREHNHDEEGNLALVAGRLLAALPPRMPKRLDTPTQCGWCGRIQADHPDGPDGLGESDTSKSCPGRHADPGAWVLHVLREHLRDVLGDMQASVAFNKAGGATLVLRDAYPEDVALFRDTLGIDLTCVLEVEHDGETRCIVTFGADPFGPEVTMIWYTTPDFVRLAAQLAAAGWPFYPTL